MQDFGKEWIMCAALLRKNPKNSKSYHEGVNDIDKIEIGFRHHDIRNRFLGEVQTGPSAQGFYTSKGRFVSRKEAEVIARNCGQLTGDLIGGELTSEDLW